MSGSAKKASDRDGATPKAGPSEDMKAKFRAALDAKHAHGGKDVSDHSERSKIDHANGPSTSAREQMFRRKSG